MTNGPFYIQHCIQCLKKFKSVHSPTPRDLCEKHLEEFIKKHTKTHSVLIGVVGMRYGKECYKIAELASQQLNSEKNKNKPPIEDMSFDEIFIRIDEEKDEIKKEIFNLKYYDGFGEVKLKKNINKQRVKEELGDMLALCAGFLAKLEK